MGKHSQGVVEDAACRDGWKRLLAENEPGSHCRLK